MRAGLLNKQGPRISREVEIFPGCAATVACPSCLDNSPVSPGPGRVIRNMLGWSQLEKTVRSGVSLFRGALQGENLFSSLVAAGDWVRKGSCHTAWSVPCGSSCICSYAYGQGPAVGPLLAGVWRAIAPLMKPWCAEGEVRNRREPEPLSEMDFVCWLAPRRRTAVWGVRRCQAHCFSESWYLLQFSDGGVSPVLMMKATRAGLAMVTFLSWMANARTSSFLHRTDPGREQERINVTFRWVKQHASSCPLSAEQEWHAVCQRVRRVHPFQLRGTLGLAFFVCFWLLFGVLCIWRVLVLLASRSCTKLGLLWCASHWTRPLGGGWWEHYLCNLWGECLAAHKTACQLFWVLSGDSWM